MFLKSGRLIRPFSRSGEIVCGGYSGPLQRRITDFGADVPFGKVSEKLAEHYGITVPYSAARHITEKHAKHMKNNEKPKSTVPDVPGVGCVIAETDGTMIPVADTGDGVIGAGLSDRRKTRKGRWKEARLTLSHAEGSVNPRFGCTLGGPDEAGDRLADCAIGSGPGQKTKVHCVGDGAPWISRQVSRVFGAQAEFLIGFYHLCEYLSSASEICAPDGCGLSIMYIKYV